jgi:hypothetical protein
MPGNSFSGKTGRALGFMLAQGFAGENQMGHA